MFSRYCNPGMHSPNDHIYLPWARYTWEWRLAAHRTKLLSPLIDTDSASAQIGVFELGLELTKQFCLDCTSRLVEQRC